MLDFDLSTGPALADDLRQLEAEAPQRIFRSISRNIIPPLERKLDRIVRREPPPRNEFSPTFIWSRDPAAQRRAAGWFFFHFPDGFERTHQLVEAWVTEIFFEAGITTISVENPAPGASYVYGDDENEQIPGHRLTGWPQIADAVVDIGAELEDDIGELWDDVVGGV